MIMVVEDEGLIALGYGVPAVASTGEEAIKKVADTELDLVVMDIRLKGDTDGIEAAGKTVLVDYTLAPLWNKIGTIIGIIKHKFKLRPLDSVELNCAPK